MTAARVCCVIGCEQLARVVIVPPGPAPWYDTYTEACADHVAEFGGEDQGATVFQIESS